MTIYTVSSISCRNVVVFWLLSFYLHHIWDRRKRYLKNSNLPYPMAGLTAPAPKPLHLMVSKSLNVDTGPISQVPITYLISVQHRYLPGPFPRRSRPASYDADHVPHALSQPRGRTASVAPEPAARRGRRRHFHVLRMNRRRWCWHRFCCFVPCKNAVSFIWKYLVFITKTSTQTLSDRIYRR